MKLCRKCKVEQPDENYYTKYHPSTCKDCIRKYQHKVRNPTNGTRKSEETALERIAKGMSTAEEFKWQIREDERDLIMRDFLRIASGEKL